MPPSSRHNRPIQLSVLEEQRSKAHCCVYSGLFCEFYSTISLDVHKM